MSGLTEKNQLLLMQDGKCFYCQRHVLLSHGPNDPLRASIDHFIPKAAGGPSDFKNKIIACAECNGKKNARRPTVDEAVRFMLMRRRYNLEVWGDVLDIIIDGARKPKLELVKTA